MTCEPILIASGDSLRLSIDWGETAQLHGPPYSVTYQVFDPATEEPVDEVQYADWSASETAIKVSGTSLTNDSARRRRLRVQITALFNGPARRTARRDVYVTRVGATSA